MISRVCFERSKGLLRSGQCVSATRPTPAHRHVQANAKGKVLVLGGTGFVGKQISQEMLDKDYDVVTLSRRPTEPSVSQGAALKHITGDLIQDPELMRDIITQHGPFTAVVHAVGMILPNSLNALASGSGSTPAEGTTYDQITRTTASQAADTVAELMPGSPFVFISAAEAGWDPDPPFTPSFLAEYLVAKRAVEKKLVSMGTSGALRPVILRPSLVWTPERPAAIPPVVAFFIGNKLGLPGIDRPVRLETLAKAAANAIVEPKWSGILNFELMEEAASS